MARIYKRSDRITVKIDTITVKLAPLSVDQKTEIQQAMLIGRAKSDMKEATKGIVLALKYAIKGVDGLEDSDGNPYKLKFEDDILSQESIDDLLNLEIAGKLSMVCAGMMNGIPKSFTDTEGDALVGVQVVPSEKSSEAEVKNV